MTEFEAEQQAMSTIMRIILEFRKQASETNKKEFSEQEVLDFLMDYAEATKIHK